MSDFLNNIAHSEEEFNAQKSQIQNEVELGEEAASIAAKLPLSPETIIKSVETEQKLQGLLAQYAIPVIGASVALVLAILAYGMYSEKSKQE